MDARQILSALDFDGVDEYLTVADPASGVLDFNDTDNFTLTGWFNRDKFATEDTLVAKRNGKAAGDIGYIVYVDDTNEMLSRVSDGTDEYTEPPQLFSPPPAIITTPPYGETEWGGKSTLTGLSILTLLRHIG